MTHTLWHLLQPHTRPSGILSGTSSGITCVRSRLPRRLNVTLTISIRLIANQLAVMTLTLDLGAGPPRQEQARRVTLEAQPDKPDTADPTTPEDKARTQFGAAELGCQGVRQRDEESSNLTSFWALCQTKSEYDCHSQTAQSGPTSQVPGSGAAHTAYPRRRRLRNLPLYL
jgi:hypothetical protein